MNPVGTSFGLEVIFMVELWLSENEGLSQTLCGFAFTVLFLRQTSVEQNVSMRSFRRRLSKLGVYEVL
jgi:hypothetical protein